MDNQEGPRDHPKKLMRRNSLLRMFLFFPLLALGAASQKTSPENTSASHFEGVMDMRLIMESGMGDLELSLSGDMAKLDMQITVHPLPDPIRLAVLIDAKTPKTAYLLSEMTKTYSSLNLTDQGSRTGKDMEKSQSKNKYKLTVLGRKPILGLPCTHITLVRDKDLIDAWVTKELPDVYAVLKKLQQANPQIGEAALFQALEESGQAGLPLNCIVIRDGQRVTTEVKRIDRRALPASLFQIPKNYVLVQGVTGGQQATQAQIEEMKKVIQGALEGQ